MRTLLFRSLKSSKISFHLFEDEFHNDFNFHKPTILDLKPLSLKCLSGSLLRLRVTRDARITNRFWKFFGKKTQKHRGRSIDVAFPCSDWFKASRS